MMKPSKSKALERLQNAVEAIPHLRELRHGSQEFEKWRRDAEVAIENTFRSDSRHVDDFRKASRISHWYRAGTPDSVLQDDYRKDLSLAEAMLQSIIDEVCEYWPDDDSPASGAGENTPSPTRDVFIIHGHDHGTKETVARFVGQLGLNPVILHEKPNEGRTIIEKFEAHATPVYAIALLTPDDVGAAKAGRPLHVQCSYPSRPIIKIITLYEPDPDLWENYRIRKYQQRRS